MDVFKQAKQIIFEPNKFFKSVVKEEISEAIKYLALILIVPSILVGVVNFIVYSFLPQTPILEGLEILSSPSFLAISTALGYYFQVLLGSFISAGILHIFVYLIGNGKGYENTYKAFVYASTPALFLNVIVMGITPYFQTLALETTTMPNILFFQLLGIMVMVGSVTFVWNLVLLVKGLKILHKYTTGKALLVIFLPIIIILLLVLFLVVGVFFLVGLTSSLPAAS